MTSNAWPNILISARASFSFFAALVLCSCTTPLGTVSNHDAPQAQTAEGCLAVMSQTHKPKTRAPQLPRKFQLVSWNIEKGNNSGWLEELKSLAKDADLALIQEAMLIPEMSDPHNENIYWSFSAGYKRSGILTLSRVKPSFICSLMVKEPWLRSPKVASITHYNLAAANQPLLVVNLHAVNFTIGVKAYRRQLDAVAQLIEAHKGPIILAGDINTWNDARKRELQKLTQKLQLSAVEFTPDERSRKMGEYVDYVFLRGLQPVTSHTGPVDTSDHNPLVVTVELPSDA